MELTELKKYAGEMLEGTGVGVKTKLAKQLIAAFYIGHYAGREPPAYVATCLMSSRHAELVIMP